MKSFMEQSFVNFFTIKKEGKITTIKTTDKKFFCNLHFLALLLKF